MGPVFHSLSSQMPLYSVPPPFIPPFHLPLFPPPINDPFVWVFFAAVGWRASAEPSPKTSGLLKQFSLAGHDLRSSYLAFSILILLFIAVFVCLFAYYSFFTIFVLIRHAVWQIFEIPSLPSVHYTHWCSTFFHQKPLCLYAFRPPSFSHCVALNPLKACRDLKIDLSVALRCFPFALKQTATTDRDKKKSENTEMAHGDQCIRYYKQTQFRND